MVNSSDTILITGGTGSLGNALAEYLLPLVKKVIVYSRDELKQANMAAKFAKYDNLRFFIGDIRDSNRLSLSLRGVDVVIHAAALKRVESCSYNPSEGIATNIIGSTLIAQECIRAGVKQALFVSSDKAAEPITPYGQMKALAESTWLNYNNYSGGITKFIATRYGNVINSNGSFYHTIKAQAPSGTVTITDKEMTRFYMTLQQAVELNISALEQAKLGGEIFIPKLKAASLLDFIDAFAPNCQLKVIGMRGIEKLHECMIAAHEIGYTYDYGNNFTIFSSDIQNPGLGWTKEQPNKPLVKPFRYTSDKVERLNKQELIEMIK